MPWSFPWTEFLKKRACRYLLQHYLGQFLKEKLTLDQLSVDLYNGKGTIKDLELDVESLNEALNNLNVPVEIVDGFINKISVSIPWTTLVQSSTEMDIHGLELTLQPKQRNQNVSGLETMFNSMSSMNTSLQIAEDCLKSAKSDGDQGGDISQPYEGVQKFAQTIDSVLCRVKVCLVDTVIRLEHLPVSSEKGVAMEIRIKRIEYFDDMAKEEGSPVDDVDKVHVWEPAAIACKNIVLEGVQIFSDEFSRNSRHSDSHSDSSLSSPKTFMSTASSLPSSPDIQSEQSTHPSYSDALPEPIQIAVLTGRTNLKLKVKQGESVQGPKLETEFEFGGVHVLLSPKQFHCVLELLEGLSSPATNDSRKRRSRSSKSKPMCGEDYQKVEKELQRQLQSGRVQQQQQQRLAQTQHQYFGMGMQDILTHSIDEGEEEQYFSLGPDRMRDMESSVNSNYSINSNRSTSTVSTVRQGQRKEGRHGKDSLQRILDDPSAELCRYHLRVAFFSFSLLNENPNQRVELSSNSTHEKQSKMRDIANTYFQKVFSFSAAGLSDLKDVRGKFTDALHFDHLRFIGKPLKIDCTEKTVPTHQSLTLDVSVGLFEALECLFNRGTDQSQPEYTELLVFPRDVSDRPTQMYSSVYSGEASIKATIKNIEQIRGPLKAKSCPKTEVNITLGQLESEIDVTLVDRLNSLVKPEPLHRTYLSTGSNGQQSGGMQYTLADTLEEGSMSSDRKIDVSVTSGSTKVIFRFPIPDLRPASEVGKLPWWQKNLRDEILVLQLEEARFQTSYMSSQILEELDFSCKEALGSFRIDPNQNPVPFAYVSCEGDNEDGFNFPQLIIKFSERTMSELEEAPSMLDNSPTLDSLNGACEFSKRTPSPFSSKKHMYGKEEMSEKDHTSTHVSKELIMPGDREEMTEFQEKSTSNSKMTVELRLPYVNLFLPDTHFYEVLYNRINNDLLLWEPMAPFPLQTQDPAGGSIQPFDLSCYPNILQDHFSMAKSAMCESSDEDEDMSFGYYSIHDSRYPKQKQQGKQLPNKMCLSLKIDKGKLTAHTKSQIEHTHGEVIAAIEDGQLFVVSHYQGDPCLQYICFLSNKAELYHAGAVQNKKEEFDLHNFDVPSSFHKHRTIYQSEPGVQCHYASDIGYDLDSVDMLSVAVKVKQDSTPISDLTRDEKIKEFLVAVGVRDATLQHRMAESKQNWISQVLNFLDVKDYDVLGYTMPKVLTELHVHLWNCSVDYRPLFLPTKAILAAKSFSISSNIVAESPTSLLRFVLDDAGLYLSQKSGKTAVDLKKDYVCVIDLERFELEFRSSDGKDQRFPITDLRVLTNRINIRTCSDSCVALTELIQYFASDGDLADSEGRVQFKEEDIIPDTMSKNSPDNEEDSEDTGLSVSCQEHLNIMVEDAMQESSSASGNELDGANSPAKPPMEVFFVPDSDENSQTLPPAGVMRPIVISASADSVTSSAISDQAETFSDDEEFCIIDDPGLGIAPKDGEPEVRVYTEELIEIKENYFSQPLGRTDLLKAPEHFPNPEYRYTLKELTAVWYMYGGSDFGNKPVHLDHDKEVVMTKKARDVGDYIPDLSVRFNAKGTGATTDKTPWQVRGGQGRDLSTLMELQLSKVRMQYEIYPSHTEQSSRQVLVIHDVEVRDRLVSSSINKFLYQYSSETMPKQTHANMVVVKALHTRPDPADKTEECTLRVSLQPLRLNIDQDSLFFLKKFFTELGVTKNESKIPAEKDTEIKQKTSSSAPKSSGVVHPPPVMTVGQQDSPQSESDTQEMLMMFDDMQKSSDKGQITQEQETGSITQSTGDLEADNKSLPVFIKSFVFSPDVPIRLDYHGKKWVGDHGTVAGLLVGLAHLNCSELKLKKLNYRHGFLGLDKLQAHCVHEWVNDIIKNQLPSILGGVGPMHSFVQLGQGIRDLFWLPVEQYKRDGRIVRGIQRGATSFSTSTAMAVLELTNRMVQSVQYVAEVTYDMVTPGPSVRMQRHRLRGPPADVREGVENAYIAIKEGFSTTAQNIVDVASKEHEQKGMTGAVGAAIRLVPPTVISPFIIATEATSNVLGGMRNQLQPDAKKEEEEKWKPNQT